jgi:hypothetical protein
MSKEIKPKYDKRVTERERKEISEERNPSKFCIILKLVPFSF